MAAEKVLQDYANGLKDDGVWPRHLITKLRMCKNHDEYKKSCLIILG